MTMPAPATNLPPKGCQLPASRRSDGWVWINPAVFDLDPRDWSEVTGDPLPMLAAAKARGLVS